MLSSRAGKKWLMGWMLGGAALLAGCGVAEQEAQPLELDQSTAAVIDCKAVAGATTICGKVTDANGNPLGGAQVRLGSSQVLSQADGSFSVSASVAAGSPVSIIAVGYMPYVGAVTGDVLGARYVLHTLHRQTFQSAGGIVSVLDPRSGAGIQVDLAALMTASGSTPTPPLTVGVRYIDTRLLAMPGDDGAVNSAGQRVFLETRGAIYSEVRDARGNLLRLRPGANARVNIPITNDMVGNAPASIALWSMPANGNTNQWRQQPAPATNTSNPTRPTGCGEHTVSCNADDCSRISPRAFNGPTNEIGFINADIEKNTPACLAINVDVSALPPGTPLPICLKFDIAVPGGGVQTRNICVDGGSDVLYNLPPNANITVSQAGGVGCPPPPGTSVTVNTGAPWGGTGVPASPGQCNGVLNLPPLP